MLDIGRNLKVVRVSKRISQKELATKVGITTTYLSLIENSRKTPSLGLIERISSALGTPLAVLFTELSLG